MTFEEFKEKVVKAIPQEKFEFIHMEALRQEERQMCANGYSLDVTYGQDLSFTDDYGKIGWKIRFRSVAIPGWIESKQCSSLQEALLEVKNKYIISAKQHLEKLENDISLETYLLVLGGDL